MESIKWEWKKTIVTFSHINAHKTYNAHKTGILIWVKNWPNVTYWRKKIFGSIFIISDHHDILVKYNFVTLNLIISIWSLQWTTWAWVRPQNEFNEIFLYLFFSFFFLKNQASVHISDTFTALLFWSDERYKREHQPNDNKSKTSLPI